MKSILEIENLVVVCEKEYELLQRQMPVSLSADFETNSIAL
jgi:hypothetical protein